MNYNIKQFPTYFNKGKDLLKINPGGVFKFYQGDREEKFKENLKTQPEDWYYRHNDVTYTVNSYGYRTKEFKDIDWKNSIVIFGCSNIFGIGIDDSNTISHYLSQHFDRDVINLGISAASNELIYYVSLLLKKTYGVPYGVIYSWTSCNRMTYFEKDGITHLGPWNYHDEVYTKKINRKLYEMMESDWVNSPIKSHFMMLSAEELWKNETKFYQYTIFKDSLIDIDFLSGDNMARDFAHSGIDSNKNNAMNIYNKFI